MTVIAVTLPLSLAYAGLTALALALVGHFGMVAQAVSGRIWRLDDSRGLLTLAADAALGGDADSDEPAFQAGVNAKLGAATGGSLRGPNFRFVRFVHGLSFLVHAFWATAKARDGATRFRLQDW